MASDVALNPSAEDYGSSTTPILLSVRKRSTSDSGYSGEDYSSCDSPAVLHRDHHAGAAANTGHKSKNVHGLALCGQIAAQELKN